MVGINRMQHWRYRRQCVKTKTCLNRCPNVFISHILGRVPPAEIVAAREQGT